MNQPNYIFESGNVYKLVDGQVVASMKESEWDGADFNAEAPPAAPQGAPVDPAVDPLADPLAGGETPTCATCGNPGAPEDQFCSQCGTPVEGADAGVQMPPPPEGIDPALDDPALDAPQAPPVDIGRGAKVVTPNGLEGHVLGKTRDMWGEQVTVRFANGNIRHLPVTPGLRFEAAEEAPKQNPVEALRTRLASEYPVDRDSLVTRAKELDAIAREAATRIAEGVSFEDQRALDEVATQAQYEKAEVAEAMAGIDAGEIEPYQPFEPEVVEQASVGVHGDGSWIQDTLNDMIAESQDTDYQQLLDEGPESFAAELDSDVLADQGATLEMAASFIRTKTAGADDEASAKYEKAWLARVEEVRRAELAGRKQVARKQASAQKEAEENAPDSALFL